MKELLFLQNLVFILMALDLTVWLSTRGAVCIYGKTETPSNTPQYPQASCIGTNLQDTCCLQALSVICGRTWSQFLMLVSGKLKQSINHGSCQR